MKRLIERSLFIPVAFLALVPGFAADPREGPRIHADFTRHQFGSHPANQRKSVDFTISNKGDSGLEIFAVRTNCGCAAATAGDMLLQPGQSTVVRMDILENSIYGNYIKQTFVVSNDPEQQVLSLTVAGRAVAIARVVPAGSIEAGRVKPGGTWTGSRHLRHEEGVVFGEIAGGGDCIVNGALERIDSENHEIALSIHAGKNRLGAFSCDLRVPVVAPEGWPDISLKITGYIGGKLHVAPWQSVIPGSHEGNYWSCEFKVRLEGYSDDVNPELFEIQGAGPAEYEIMALNRNTAVVSLKLPSLPLEELTEIIIGYPDAPPAFFFIRRRP